MAKRLSFQQIQILKKLVINPCYANELTHIYSYANLYRSLNLLICKQLVMKIGNKYKITHNGIIITKLY